MPMNFATRWVSTMSVLGSFLSQRLHARESCVNRRNSVGRVQFHNDLHRRRFVANDPRAHLCADQGEVYRRRVEVTTGSNVSVIAVGRFIQARGRFDD